MTCSESSDDSLDSETLIDSQTRCLPQVVLIRTFGSGSEMFIDRNQEIQVFHHLLEPFLLRFVDNQEA